MAVSFYVILTTTSLLLLRTISISSLNFIDILCFINTFGSETILGKAALFVAPCYLQLQRGTAL